MWRKSGLLPSVGCPQQTTALQSVNPAVRVPERFRGGCAFGAA